MDRRCGHLGGHCSHEAHDMDQRTAKDHRKVPRLPQSVRWPEVRGCAQRVGRNFQGSGRRLGSDSGLHGLLRGLPGSVGRNSRCCGRLRLQSADLQRPCREDEKTFSGTCERTPGYDGHHRHVLPGQVFAFASCRRDMQMLVQILSTLLRTCLFDCFPFVMFHAYRICRTGSQDRHGVIGLTTRPRRCVLLRTSWECKIPLDSGIPQERSMKLELGCGVWAFDFASVIASSRMFQ